jgi:hypothetical protein
MSSNNREMYINLIRLDFLMNLLHPLVVGVSSLNIFIHAKLEL